MNPYEKCPVFENEKYLLRLTDKADAEDLLLVYSDQKAVPLFNCDNCFGDFHMTSLEQVQNCIMFWQEEYQRKSFVRWTIFDKNASKAVGTIELFNRQADDYFNNFGLLRLYLRSDYEKAEIIKEILLLILQPIFEMFDCEMIATKIKPIANERIKAAQELNLVRSEEKLIGGHSGKVYTDYYVLKK